MQDIETFFNFKGEEFNPLTDNPKFSEDIGFESYEEFTIDGKKWYRCTYPDCGKNFRYKSEMMRHHVIHYDNRPYKCPYEGCNKGFKRLDGLETHVRTHTKDMPFECNISGCGQKFSTRASLRYHLLKHNNEKPFKCSFEGCEKSFFTQTQLKQHEKAANYHKKIHPAKPIPMDSKIEVQKASKQRADIYNQFYAPTPKPAETIQWEIKDLAEEDNFVEERVDPKFEDIMKSVLEENKSLKQNADLYSKLIDVLKENSEMKSQIGIFPEDQGFSILIEKQPSGKKMDGTSFFDDTELKLLDFLRDRNSSF